MVCPLGEWVPFFLIKLFGKNAFKLWVSFCSEVSTASAGAVGCEELRFGSILFRSSLHQAVRTFEDDGARPEDQHRFGTQRPLEHVSKLDQNVQGHQNKLEDVSHPPLYWPRNHHSIFRRLHHLLGKLRSLPQHATLVVTSPLWSTSSIDGGVLLPTYDTQKSRSWIYEHGRRGAPQLVLRL